MTLTGKWAATGAAQRLAPLVEQLLGGELPVRVRMWDGSETGAADGPLVHVRSRRALRRLLWAPGELGLAEAYISGDVDIEGDLADGLRAMRHAVRERGLQPAGLQDPGAAPVRSRAPEDPRRAGAQARG
ncbi:SAM-dependent methyltransferase, partial [Streptomyces sp. NPDC047939]